MKSNTKAKLMLLFLCSLISLSFVFGSNVANYSVKLSENPVNTSGKDLADPRTSTNGAFKIYWAANGTAVTDSETANTNGNAIISDGEGGAIIAFKDVNNDVYAQKINSDGYRLWGTNGIVICNASGTQDWVTLCTDDMGGAIIAWEDSRTAVKDIYAQHINSTGHTQWGESWWSPNDRNGTVICNATDIQEYPQICKDWAKGAIITWEDDRNPTTDIYAQRVDSNGITHWGESWWSPNDRNGTVICNATIYREEIRICSDESGGAILTWYDRRTGTDCIYAQHVDSNGITHWGESWWSPNDRNGTVICNHTYGTNFPNICKDGANGAIIAWADERNPTTDIYAQRVDSNGITHWGESWWSPNDRNGTVICNATETQDYVYLCEDGAGGAFLTWLDNRGDTDVYAQHVDSDGITHWGDGKIWGAMPDRNGTVACNAPTAQEYPQICKDGAGGAILVWKDTRSSDNHIYVQRVSSDGTTHWGDGSTPGGSPDRNGTAVFNWAGGDAFLENGEHEFSTICFDDNGGAIIVWVDDRDDNSQYNLFAQRVRGWIPSPGGALPAGDDDDDDDEDTGMVVVVVVIIIIACVGGVVVVVIVLIKKGVIGTSRG